MFLNSLSLINFKNCREAELVFSPKINCLVGDNGMGKTNVLDAIHYLSFCKSAFNPIDSQNIHHEEDFFVLKGVFNKDDQMDSVFCGVKRNHKKQFKCNNKDYSKLSEHIGAYPLVIVSPYDSEIILGGSEIRRSFLNSVISQYDKRYLELLLTYNKILDQRNSLLKQFAVSNNFNEESLSIWNDRLEPIGVEIFNLRKEFFASFIPIFQKYYRFIAEDHEEVGIIYESQLDKGKFGDLMTQSLKKDLALEYTTVGIHKDDLVFTESGYPVKRFGSQGQQKTFVLALKLAEFDFIKEIKGYKPLMLFDDVFDKLDKNRVTKLLELVSEENFGQIFLTDTGMERTKTILQAIKSSYSIFEVKDGVVNSIESL